MADDIRLLVGLQGHRKVKKLERRVGIGALKYLIYIWLEVRKSCPSGDTSRWTAEDFALAAEYDGEPEKLVAALVESEWLEAVDGGWAIHDWADHQPFAVDAKARSEAAAKAARIRWNKRLGLDSDTKDVPPASAAHASRKEDAIASSVPLHSNQLPEKEPADKQPSADFKPFVDAVDAAYRRTHEGAKPTWGPKQGKLAKDLLRKHGLSECLRRLEILETGQGPDWLTDWDLGTLVSQFDKLAKPSRPKARKAGHDPLADRLFAIAAPQPTESPPEPGSPLLIAKTSGDP